MIASSAAPVGLVLQVLTLAVAAVGPVLAFQYAKRLALGSNRQAWLDALREDIAELIALSDILTVRVRRMRRIEDVEATLLAEEGLRETAAQLQVVRFRTRLRLRSGNPRHDRLIAAIEEMVKWKSIDAGGRNERRAEVVAATEVLVHHVWAKILAGR